jgi:hypothetical protein
LLGSFDEIVQPLTPVSDVTSASVQTIAFPDRVSQIVRKANKLEATLEAERAAKRARRIENNILSASGSTAGTPGPGTPGTLGDRAPDLKAPTKKELKASLKAKASDAQQHTATNDTLNAQFGGAFGKKTPTWLSKGTGSTNTGFTPQKRPNASSQAQSQGGGTSAAKAITGGRFGDWREDKENGAGVQLRDIVAVLEPEPKEKKALARALNKLNSKK